MSCCLRAPYFHNIYNNNGNNIDANNNGNNSDTNKNGNNIDDSSEISDSQSIDITSININIHDSRGYDLRLTSKTNISTAIVKQNNPLAIDNDMVNIPTTNATLNNQMDVDSIAIRMKFEQTKKKQTP
jgi:hypothetical protein